MESHYDLIPADWQDIFPGSSNFPATCKWVVAKGFVEGSDVFCQFVVVAPISAQCSGLLRKEVLIFLQSF